MNAISRDWKAQFTTKRFTVSRWNSTKFAIVDRTTKRVIVTAPKRSYLIGARNELNKAVVR